MLSLPVLSLALALYDRALGANIPISRQFHGLGMDDDSSSDDIVRTPGKLRVTENSGVCGMSL